MQSTEHLHELLESKGYSVVKEWNHLYVSTSDGRFLAEVVLEGRRLVVERLEAWEESKKLLEQLKKLVDEGARDEILVSKTGLKLSASVLEEIGFMDMGDYYGYYKSGSETLIPL